MSSISSSTTLSAIPSPRARMNSRLEAATSAGTISKTDEVALSSALDDIDKALASSSSSGAAGTRAAPEDMKAKINSLIDQEVKDGKLTDEQASELKDLFGANATEATQGAQGPRGPGGPPPPPPADSDDDDSTTTDSTTTETDKLDALAALLQKLRDTVASTDTYGTSETSSASQAGLLIDQSI